MPTEYTVPKEKWTDPIEGQFLRLAAGGLIPASWYLPNIPPIEARAAKSGILDIEIVSHCWNYAHLLNHQLSSLVQFPPAKGTITMTVFYCSEDKNTSELLAFFSKIDVPNITWNWCELPRIALFRRTIGRNKAALETKADWVWFTDCDLMFREGCLDGLIDKLQNRQDALVYPKIWEAGSLTDFSTSGLVIDVPSICPSEYQVRDKPA